MAGRRFGKTDCMMTLACLTAAKGKRVFFICPTYKQCRDWFKNILQLIPGEIVTNTNKSDLTIEFAAGEKGTGIIKFFSGEPDAIERCRGYECDLCIIDEFCNIANQNYVYYDIVRPLVAITKGRVFIISTPKSTANFFYQAYLKGKQGIDGFESFKFSSLDNPFFPKEEYEQIRATTPSISFQQEYECNPQANASNPFKEVDINNCTMPRLSDEPTVCYGIDIAKGNSEDSDQTCIVGLSATGKQTYFSRFRLNEYEAQYQKILTLPYPKALKVIDSSSFSAGSVIYQRIRNEGHNVIGFEFTSKSKAPLYYKLINAIEKHEIGFIEPVADELKIMELTYSDKSNVVKIAAQSGTGMHDDAVAAIAMAWGYLQRSAPNTNFMNTFGFA
ncbi:terminase large subunit domain-containing protein [Mucilaginibacter sp. 3215]|uniref:terminase large subunit domain-containing protein n=1 Tax=Mucilaginibacter sp. 3215 TaxID=3373912 RepID=UPI003D1BFEF5